MRGKYLFAVFLLLFAGACASVGRVNETAPTSYEGIADTLQKAVTAYRAMQPRLTADQKREFDEAYGQLCKSHQTLGVLLASVMSAQDEESVDGAFMSYRRLAAQLPAMAERVSRLVEGFKSEKQKSDALARTLSSADPRAVQG